MRAINLADMLIKEGHKVTLWSSAFFHQEKRHRTVKPQSIKQNEYLTINLVPSPGYKHHIGIARLYDHMRLALSLRKWLKNYNIETSLPDVVVIGYPPIETAYIMARFLKQHNISYVLDVKDQWPEVFLDLFPNVLKSFARVFLFPYYAMAKYTMCRAKLVTSMTDKYLDWISKFSGQSNQGFSGYVLPLVAKQILPTDSDNEQIRLWWQKHSLDFQESCNIVSFVGSLTRSFDFSIIRRLAQKCELHQINCLFVVAGDGNKATEVRNLLEGCNNIILPGWLDTEKSAMLYQNSIATIAPYINHESFSMSIPNKISDSWARGLPVITSLSGEVAMVIAQHSIGHSTSDIDSMYDYLVELIQNKKERRTIALRSKLFYTNNLGFEKTYGDFICKLKEIARL